MSSSDQSNDSNSVTEIVFESTGESCPLNKISAKTNCRIVLKQLLPAQNGFFIYFQISEANIEEIHGLMENETDLETRLLANGGTSGIFEIRIGDGRPYFVPLIIESGAFLSKMQIKNGEGHIVVQVPADISSCEIVDLVLDYHPTMDVVAQRQNTYPMPLFSQKVFQRAVYEELTERQIEVLLTAYINGYFQSPREKSSKEIAAEMDITIPTFTYHLRQAQHQIFKLLF
ncbi:bacterio-opsin activator domain-containing protein [Haladaptatus sp. DYF46]|uniref:helix-turn-helix domain-containing protein n=1 Tax=Haladaptatus sp. DYF46 TaxID=2886041 RepID=UPI001E5F640F|nr:bacterio-opsin activator domain-containing protein [Haladaptatus sp. DYF46]